MRNIFLLLLFACCQVACKEAASSRADRILTNAIVYTVDKNHPSAEAVAIKDGKILLVGSNAEVEALAGDSTERIDCQGKFLMPGFIEGHGHIHGLGASLMNLNLMKVKNWEEIVALVAEAVKKAKPGEWIIGRGWHQEKWDHAPSPNYLGYPYYADLDRVAPDNPVLLSHASGHSTYVNGALLKLAGISNSTPNPAGGDIVKDQNGRLVGVLEETAQNLVYESYAKWLSQQPQEVLKARWVESIKLAEAECLKHGITSFQDAGSSFALVADMRELARNHQLNIRHWLMVREDLGTLRNNATVFPIVGEGDGHLTVKAVKVSLDGALGSYGAWLLEPYADRKGWIGQNTYDLDSLKAIAEFCWNKQLQLCVHAIGDRANRETINLFADQIKQDSTRDHRWRVEHAQHVNPAEIPRFRDWNIIASMQSVHCTSDAPYVVKRLGEERAATGAYMWKAFLDAGVVVTNGTDVPVEEVNPFASFYAAVTRKTNTGEAFYPEQCMSREQAIYSYTMANAYAAFEEKLKGSIEPGKYADLVLLTNNLLTCKEEEIKNTQVVLTLVDGVPKYRQ